jgi:hypothetical protein
VSRKPEKAEREPEILLPEHECSSGADKETLPEADATDPANAAARYPLELVE